MTGTDPPIIIDVHDCCPCCEGVCSPPGRHLEACPDCADDDE